MLGLSWSHQLLCLTLLAAKVSSTGSYGEDTIKHEAGRCSMRGHCGAQGWFGSELPCPDNGLAERPEKKTREKLVSVCGEKWRKGSVCCDEDQIGALEDNLKRADTFISSCPACKENFYNLFCTFTCSPDQSLFVNITDTAKSSAGKDLVTELDNLWSGDYGSAFYDSCKDVKFGSSGSNAMSFIGGGAKNYTEFLAFLGRKSLLGSPFQINFPDPKGKEKEGMKAVNPITRACNDSDARYCCACVDCPATCPELAEVVEEESCYVGALPCLSFASILVYSILLLLGVIAVVGHVFYRRHAQRRNERLRLLHDAAPSDDEDEGDIVRNAAILDRPQRNYRLNAICDNAFSRLGGWCARFPLVTISTSVLVVVLLSLGWINFEVERDPVRLWVSPLSAAAEEKAYFDSNFGPFYRAEQVFLVNDTLESGPGPVLTYDTLRWWFDVESQIDRVKSYERNLTLGDVCLNPTGRACVVQSLTGYFGGDFSNVKRSSWGDKIRDCTEKPGEVACLPPFQLPLDKNIILGGWQDSADILQSQAMVVTWVVNNHQQGSDAEKRAMEWEASLRDLLLEKIQPEARARGLRLSFNTEISLEEELNKSSNTDANIIVISYVIMFIYVSFALGSAGMSLKTLLSNPATAMVQSKFTLGISGIVIVLMSVSASVGLFSAAGIKVTLIIAEVIPFLVLAIGVDNIFLIVHEFERVNHAYPDEEIDTRMSKALGRMGPSILLSALTETVAFVLGVFVGMPAVRNFAAYAAGAVLINALLQVTMFVAVLSLNQRRVESNRIDCFPFIRLKQATNQRSFNFGSEEVESTLQRFIRKHYAPALLNRKVKVTVLAVFLGFFAAGVALLPKISLGLDQRIAIPDDSYLIPYFNDLYDYFNTGPPVYFVTRGVNATARSHQEELCGRFTRCNTFSLPTVLEQESKRPEVSYLTGSTANWLDDFLFWLNPAFDSCCTENGKPCFAGRSPEWNITLSGMPEGREFIHYVDKWLAATPDEECSIAGKAAYGNAVVVDANSTDIPASHFRASHTPLHSQEDFIASLAAARRIADEISDKQGGDIDVFPYSKHYIFFSQYASIVRLACALLGSALALILVITSTLLGSLATGLVVTLTVAMTLVDILGTMALAGVSLNAISLVNLVICVGIGVEFCAHVARAYAFPSKALVERARNKWRGRDARVWAAVCNVGGSVFSGITVTKFLGVAVLAFTRSKVFEVYYFRVWVSLVVWAATHALVFLPVALSLFGGEGMSFFSLFPFLCLFISPILLFFVLHLYIYLRNFVVEFLCKG